MSDQYISWSWSLPKLERNGLRIWELARQRSPWKLMLEHGQGGSSHHLHIGAGKCVQRREKQLFSLIFFLTNSEDHPSPWDSSQEKRREVTSSGSAHIL